MSYDGNNNVTGVNDSVLGTFALVNDSLHRLLSGSVSSGPSAGTNFGETYDHFGNRNQEMIMAGSANESSTYLNFTQGNNRVDGYTYDAAGNLQDDGVNQYLYDGEGRLCAVNEYSTQGGYKGYYYEADGRRLAKGTLTSFSCDLTQNGFNLTNGYAYGPNGEELQEVDGNINLLHFNIFLEGTLLGTFAGTTYSAANWEYALNDWEGTKRVIANYDGSLSTSFFSGPFGDYLENLGSGADPSEQHFTGKDRDQESGLDYFLARYYNSNMGRFMSPDPSGLTYAVAANPQSLNLYSYALNNPLRFTDPTGMYCFYGGAGDTPENDSDPTDYDFSATSSSDCGSGAQWVDNPSTTVTVSGGGDNGNTLSTFPSDVSQNIQFIPGAGCSAALQTAGKTSQGVGRAYGSWPVLSGAASSHNISTALLAAIGVRETDFNNVQERLQGGGPGPGMGVFQLTNQQGVSAAQAFNVPFAANYAANMLSSNMNYLSNAFSFTPPQLLQATAASYNLGKYGISGNPNTIDNGSAGGNYGSAVVGLMKCF